MTYRADLADLIRPLLPKEWLLVTSERNIDEHTNAVVRLTQQSIARHPAAPLSKLLVTFNLQIIAPGIDLDRVEDDLDELVSLLLLVIPSLPSVVFWDGTATKVLTAVDGGHLAYDIPLTVTVTKPSKE